MAEDYSSSDLANMVKGANSPAAPKGLQQAQSAAADRMANGEQSAYAGSRLAQWTAQETMGPASQAQSWFSGANLEGPMNGWATPFVEAYQSQYDEAAKEGTLGSFFDRDGATGVVLYDHRSSADEKKKYSFGDIYENNEYKGNVYELYDRDTANMMMGAFMLDGDEFGKAVKSAKPGELKEGELRAPDLDAAIKEKRAWNDANLAKAYTAQAHETKVTATEQDLTEGVGDEAIVAGGAAGGAATGAGTGAVIGSVVPGAGTAAGAGIGALIGGTIGGVGAWLNRDSLTEQAARAIEVTKAADRQFNDAAAFSTGVHQWSKFGMRMISPGSNLVQGIEDARLGRTGDGQSEFYALDDKGERRVSKWVIGADVAASVGDGLLQFASPVGLAAYSTLMTGVVGGQVAELGLSGGHTFDDRAGTFDNIFTDDEGNLDKSSAAAGIGAIAIDAVQLGFARGLAGKVNADRARAGLGARFFGAPDATARNTTGRLPRWLGGSTDKAAAREALEAGGREVRIGGFAYTIDDAGKAVSRRGTLSLLAPSEVLTSLGAKVMARRHVARAQGAISTDDIYRTANAMASGEMKMQTALVNAIGEGSEEGIQAALEPLSHGANMDMADIYLSAAYGAAGGLGMGFGANLSTPSQRQVLEAQAATAHTLMTSGERLSKEQLRTYSDDELRQLVGTMNTAQRELSNSAARKAVDSLTADNEAGIAGTAKLLDAVRTQRDSELAKATARTDAAFVITPLEAAGAVDADGNLKYGSIPADGIAASARQTLKNFADRFDGFRIQADELEAEATRLQALDQSDPDVAAQTAKAITDASIARAVHAMSDRLAPRLVAAVDKIDNEMDLATRAADVAELNDQLRRWFGERDDDFFGEQLTPEEKRHLARAVSMVWARDPHDSAGSYPVLVPQVSLQLTSQRADNVMQVSSGILKAIRGDHDGDKLRPLNQLWLDDDAFASARSGAWYVGTGSAVHVDAPKQEKYHVEQLSRGLDATASQSLRLEAQATLLNIGTAIKKRYAGLGVDTAIDRVNQRFYDAVKANTKDARAVLLDGLAKEIGGPLTARARERNTNEWLWIDQLVRSNFQAYQEIFVAHQEFSPREVDDLSNLPGDKPRKVAKSRRVRERLGRRAATYGQTMSLMVVGESPFRQFQKLHYSSIQAPVLQQAGFDVMELADMAELYERLGQLQTQAELDRVRGVDDITARVQSALESLAADAAAQTALAAQDPALADAGIRPLTQAEALVVIANTAVRDFDYNPERDEYTPGGVISMAQMLLKLAVQRDQREKAEILASSPSLQAKHARLLEVTKPGGGRENSGVNAEKAFVEVFGSKTMGSLLGESAAVFGPQITLEQYIRSYSAMSEQDRKFAKQELTLDNPEYLGRKRTKNVPYDLQEILADEITPFRSVVDSILAVGNARDAEYVERDKRVSTQFAEAHGSIRQAMKQMTDLAPVAGETPVATVQRMLEQNPDFAHRVFELIPNSAAAVVLTDRDGRTYVNNWFYEMLAEPKAAKAEMIYYRGLLLDEWRALDVRTDEEGNSGREYSRLKRRMHRVMYRVAPHKANDMGLRMKQFHDALWEHESVSEFIEWVNTTPGMRSENEAPLVAWFDDVAEFDVDKANGGWTTSLAGAELREAIKLLATSSDSLRNDMVEEAALLKQDSQYLRAIDRVIAARNGAGVVDQADVDVYTAMEEAIRRAGELAVSLGPAAMVYQSVGNAWGFYGQAHTKGKNPAHVEAYGMFDARRDAFGFLHNYSRVMGALTAVDIDAVGNNLNLVAKDSGRTMDDYGNVVDWGTPTVEQMADLLRDPKTRSFARAMLFPTVLERTEEGQLSEKMLFGKSLQSLLDGSSFDELFPTYDVLKQGAAFKYLALVESMTRQYGGHMSISRAVNDIVIARLQAAREELTFDRVEDMVTTAYYEVAQLLQRVGSQAAAPGLDAQLRVLKAEAKRGIQQRQKPGVMDQYVLDTFRNDMKAQLTNDIAELNAAIAADPSREQEILAHIERLQREHDDFLAGFDKLLGNDELQAVVSAFHMPAMTDIKSPKEWRRRVVVQRKLVEFIDNHPSIRERVPGASVEVGRIQYQLADPDSYGEVVLSDADWDTVSRAVISLVLTDSAGPVGQGAAIRLFPGEKNVDDVRYYDKSFSYLLDPLLDPDAPAVKAAARLHLMAKRHEDIAEDNDIVYAVNQLMDPKKYGPWTPEVVIGSVEANQRIDSAAAAPAVAISGSSPKLEATVSAATARTFVMPGDELLSTVSLTAADLERPLTVEVDVTFPGATVEARPLAQLNNRFVKSVVATLPDGSTVDLLAENADLGRYWRGNATSAPPRAGTPVEFHLDRLAEAMSNSAQIRGVDPTSLRVDVAFFHPDSQPAGSEWYNNLWFEGTSFALDADRHASLNETLWFALGSLSPEGQAAALDAAKNGKTAMQVIAAPTAADRAADEDGWETDLAAVLRRKTQRILDTDLGFGKLEPEFYNAVAKGLKLRHFVLKDGEVYTAEQVIELQRAGQTFDDATLWTPSDTVLRSMLGEQGDMGVTRLFDDQIDYDQFRIPPYRGVTDTMKERFREGLSGGTKRLEDTVVVNRARQSALNVRTMLPRKVRDQFVERYRRLAQTRNEETVARTSLMQTKDGFSPSANLRNAATRAYGNIEAENVQFAFRALGIPFVGPRDPNQAEASKLVLRELASVTEDNGRRTGWILRNGEQSDYVTGVLGEMPLGNDAPRGMRPILGDLVVMELDSYGDGEQASKDAKAQIDKLAATGASVVLTDPSSGSDLRGEMAAYVQSLGYEKIAGAKHAYAPVSASSWYAVQVAREDTLVEVRGITSQSRPLVFNAYGVPIQEGGAWSNPRVQNRQTIKVMSDLLPISSMGGFGLPQRTGGPDDQISRVVRHLQGLDDPTILVHLMKESKVQVGTQAEKDFIRAWRRMMDRIARNDGEVLPRYDDGFEIGDMLPLVDNNGRILIYRHGNKRPSRDELKAMWRKPIPNRERGAGNVAVYFGQAEEQASVHSGFPVEFKERAGYGLSVEMEVPLQEFGDKQQLQWDGTKYTIVPWPDASQPGSPVLPDATILDGADIALLSDYDTRASKEGFDSVVNNHRNAFALVGMDFTVDLTEFFFPGEGNDAIRQQTTREILRWYSNTVERIDVDLAHEFLNMDLLHSSFEALLPEFTEYLESHGISSSWVTTLDNNGTAAQQITRAALIYLTTPGARPEHILKTGALYDTTAGPDAQSRLMPRLFTQVFDNARIGSPLRTEINRRINSHLGKGYRMLQNFDVVIDDGSGKRMHGQLSFPEVHSSGDNPVTNGMSFRDDTTQQVSMHSAMVADQAIGARTFASRLKGRAQQFKDTALGLTDAGNPLTPGVYDDGGVWRMLSDVPVKDRSFDSWSAPLPAEIERRGLAYDAMVLFRKPIDKSGDHWSDRERTAYDEHVRSILSMLNLPQELTGLVDGWVRQMSGRPAGMQKDGVEFEPLTGAASVEWVREVRDNVSNGYLPTTGGYVPLLHVHDLKQIRRSNQSAVRPWNPRMGIDMDEKAASWDDWTKAAIGSALATDVKFERIYLLPVDGFMHSYQHATRDLSELPVSVDVLVTQQILSFETNRLLQSVTEAEITQEDMLVNRLESIDPRTQALVESTMVLDTAKATLTDLLNGQRIAGEFRGEAAPASAKGKQDARLRRHRKQSGLPTPVAKSMTDFRKNSTEFIHHSTTTNAMVRGLMNMRVGTTLLNPALYVSMPVELAVRGSLDRISNVLSGTNTTGLLQAKMSQAIAGRENLGAVWQAMGLETTYTPDQVRKIRKLLPVMGADPQFRAMIYRDLNYVPPVEEGQSKLGRGLAAYARAGSRVQDPTWGQRGDALARRYLEGALSHIIRTGALTGASVDTVIDQLHMNPSFLQQNFPEASLAGSNTLAQIRSVKDTPLSLALRWIYEPMSQNPNSVAINSFGNLVLRMPMMFSNYLGNVGTTILGLQGYSDMLAAFLDGKNKGPNSMFGRIAAKLRGDQFDENIDGEFDMSTVLEGVDLARSFIRGGLTHTGLFTMAMMAGGLGLSGEDDEMKRRRRAAELQGAAVLYDPRKIENDWRNADEIYLDWLPFGWDSYFKDPETGRAMAQTHWLLKQFISPIVGMEKFMETGNFNHVKWGFIDALGSFPLINANMVNDVFETQALFEAQAAEAAAEGTDEANVRAAGLLTQVVGAYEKMLLENSFINAIYIGMDEVDRDPYAEVMTDSDGDIQRDGLQMPRQTQRLSQAIDPVTGEPMVTYLSRSDASSSLAVNTENRFTLALLSMPFTGLGQSEYWRYNMVPKIREIEKPTVTEPMAQAYILAAYKNLSGMRNLTVEEALDQIKQEYMARGEWYDGEDSLMAEARRRSMQSGGPAMTMMTEAGEQLTDEGAKAIFRGLKGGTMTLDDPDLQRLYIPYPMREQIADEWTKELTAEGVSMGLTHSDAVSRMKRIMYGQFGNSESQGLADILFSDQISGQPKARYVQLNTTYVIGPDGRPWATGWKRDAAKGGLGIFGSALSAAGLMPLKRTLAAADGMSKDSRGNTVDNLNGINTGLRGLMALPESPPTDEEIGKAIEKAIEDAAKQDYSGFTPFANRSGGGYGYRKFGYTPYRRSGYRRYGGGGYGSSGYPNFTRMYALPTIQSPYSNDISFINTSNPILRRADIRRERIWSERGRLNQWQ